MPTYEAFAQALVDVARPTGLTLIVEPGRTLVGPAGVLLARVIDVKPHAGGGAGGGRFVVLDAGMTELLRPALYGAFHRIVPVLRDRPPARRRATSSGRCARAATRSAARGSCPIRGSAI